MVAMCICYALQRRIREFPEVISRMCLCLGVVCALDPILILLVDVIEGNWKYSEQNPLIGDAFKLAEILQKREGES